MRGIKEKCSISQEGENEYKDNFLLNTLKVLLNNVLKGENACTFSSISVLILMKSSGIGAMNAF